jgi:hypothetical protein
MEGLLWIFQEAELLLVAMEVVLRLQANLLL